MSDPQQRISSEKEVQLLSEQQRRQILHQVADTPNRTAVDQFTKLEVAEFTNPRGNRSSDHRGIELHHVHLSKLREADVIVNDSAPSKATADPI